MAEINLSKAKYSSRLYAAALDFFIMTLIALAGVLLMQKICRSAPFFKAAGETLNEVERKSHLYHDDGKSNLTILSKFLTYEDENEIPDINSQLDSALKDFYTEPDFFDQTDPNSGLTLYTNERLNSGLFIWTSDEHIDVIPKTDTNIKDLHKFYCNAMENTATQYMMQYPQYVEATKIINLTFFFLILLIPIVLSVTICELVIPLIFKRGRKTLGKLLLKIGVVDSRGLSPKMGRFICRFLLFLFVEILLSLVSFGIPIIVSFTMFLLTKKNQGFHDYVANTVVVDTSNNRIFVNENEYFEKMSDAEKLDLYKKDIKY